MCLGLVFGLRFSLSELYHSSFRSQPEVGNADEHDRLKNIIN